MSIRVTYSIPTTPPMTQDYFFDLDDALAVSVGTSEGSASLASVKSIIGSGLSDAEVERRCVNLVKNMLTGGLGE